MKFFIRILLVFALIFLNACESMLETEQDLKFSVITEDFVFETTKVVELDIILANYDGRPGDNVKFSIFNNSQQIAAGITDRAGRYSTKLVLPTYVKNIKVVTNDPEYRGDVSVLIHRNRNQIYLYNDLKNNLSTEKPAPVEKASAIQKTSDNSTTLEEYEFGLAGVTDNGDGPYNPANGDLNVYIENVAGRSCIDVYYNGGKLEEITESKLITLYVNSDDEVRVITYDDPDHTGNYCGWFVQYGSGSFTIEENDYIVDLANPLINSHNYVKVTPWIAAGNCQCSDEEGEPEYNVCDGYPDWQEKYASVRYKSFGNTGSNEHYLGVNDLGDGGNRVETGFTWNVPGSFDIEFEYDAASHTLISIIDNDPSTRLEYVIGHAPDNPINVMGIDVVQRTTGATVEFNKVQLDGKNVGDFTGDGWQSWTVSDFDGSDGFVVTGTIDLTGDFSESSSEMDKIQISLGYEHNPCEDNDDDGDGVENDDDDYPDDPDKAFNNITDGFLAYEDLWPEKGDYDFNDLVIDYTINQITNADNNIVEIEMDLEVIAAGAKYNNAFGIEIPDLMMANIARIDGEFFHETELPNSAESVNGNFVIIPFDHTQQFFSGNTHYINTRSYPPETTKKLSYTIVLNTPQNITTFASPPYNPFIIIDSGTDGDEVHLTGKPGTFVSPLAEDPYTDENGMPWAIHIAGDFDYPMEKKDIREAYFYFTEWANSNGDLYKDWYKNQAGYRNADLTYTQED